jgi:hypothetical protein
LNTESFTFIKLSLLLVFWLGREKVRSLVAQREAMMHGSQKVGGMAGKSKTMVVVGEI